MKDILDALKALLPLFGAKGDGLAIGANLKQVALRYFSALTLLSVVVWGLDKLSLMPVPVMAINLYGFEFDAKVVAAIAYGVFYGGVAIVWSIILSGASFALRGNSKGRLAVALSFGTVTLFLTGFAACLLAFGIVFGLTQSYAALYIAGCLIFTLFAYSFSRLAMWLQTTFTLSGPVASGASSLLCLLLIGSNYLLLAIVN